MQNKPGRIPVVTGPVIYEVECSGRNASGQKVLEKPLCVRVKVMGPENGSIISTRPEGCPHSRGDSEAPSFLPSYQCTTSNDVDVPCPYAVDIPTGVDALFERVKIAAV